MLAATTCVFDQWTDVSLARIESHDDDLVVSVDRRALVLVFVRSLPLIHLSDVLLVVLLR